MGGINTLSGLNNVSVDFRPTIPVNVPKTGNANQPLPGADAVPEAAPQPEKAKARSVVKELDVLLLGAAGKSVSADAAAQVKAVGKVLVEKNVLTQGEVSKLESLAKDDVTITKSDNTKVTVGHDIECVSGFLVRNCPSYYKRDYFHQIFKKPSHA